MMHTPTSPTQEHFGINKPCRVLNCPLNEAGIQHNVGIYRHVGGPKQKTQSVSVIFGCVPFPGLDKEYKKDLALTLNSESRPPTFIWEASQKREEAMAKIRKEDDVEKNRTIAEEMADLVGRFCDLHTAEAHFGS